MGPSREEFERMYLELRDGFAGVNTRLDKLNGTVAKHEVRIAEEAQKTKSLEKEIFPIDRAGRRSNDPETRQTAWSKQQGFMIGIGFGVLWGVLKVLELLGAKAFGAALAALSKAGS